MKRPSTPEYHTAQCFRHQIIQNRFRPTKKKILLLPCRIANNSSQIKTAAFLPGNNVLIEILKNFQIRISRKPQKQSMIQPGR